MSSSVADMGRWIGAFGLLLVAAAAGAQTTFESPEQAVQALSGLIGTHADRRLEEIFGPGSVDLFRSGDAAADQEDAQHLKSMLNEKVDFEDADAHTKIILAGSKAWPLPIPLVENDKRWRFDTAAGREELLNRRIGHNELDTLSTMHEVVDAQI